MLTLFTFTFAKRGIQCNIAHRTQIKTFRTKTTLAPFMTVHADCVIFFGIRNLLGTIVYHPDVWVRFWFMVRVRVRVRVMVGITVSMVLMAG